MRRMTFDKPWETVIVPNHDPRTIAADLPFGPAGALQRRRVGLPARRAQQPAGREDASLPRDATASRGFPMQQRTSLGLVTSRMSPGRMPSEPLASRRRGEYCTGVTYCA